MPLTTAKARHITARIDRLFAQRSQSVTLTYGPGTVRTIQGIFRIAQTGADLVGVEHADAVLLIQARDIDFPTLRSVSLVKPAAGSMQDQIATNYAITGIIPRGILAAPDRYYCYLERSVQVTLTLLAANNTTTSLVLWSVVRPIAEGDPTLGKEGYDAILYLRYDDATLAQLRACIYLTIAANQPPHAAAAGDFATRYIIASIHAERIPENMDRWIIGLERQR